MQSLSARCNKKPDGKPKSHSFKNRQNTLVEAEISVPRFRNLWQNVRFTETWLRAKSFVVRRIQRRWAFRWKETGRSIWILFAPGFRCPGGSEPYVQYSRCYFANETGMQLGWQSLGVSLPVEPVGDFDPVISQWFCCLDFDLSSGSIAGHVPLVTMLRRHLWILRARIPLTSENLILSSCACREASCPHSSKQREKTRHWP